MVFLAVLLAVGVLLGAVLVLRARRSSGARDHASEVAAHGRSQRDKAAGQSYGAARTGQVPPF